jgi:hypothetical protein
MSLASKLSADMGRRRTPRREFIAPVGILLNGKYAVERSYQVGEGGMMLSLDNLIMEMGRQVAVTFFLPSGYVVMVRGVVRSVIQADQKFPIRYGIEFVNLGFQSKRAIRNFVAAATHGDGHINL